MSVQMIARRYASALADVILQRGEAKEVQHELQQWEELLQTNDLYRTLATHLTAVEEAR